MYAAHYRIAQIKEIGPSTVDKVSITRSLLASHIHHMPQPTPSRPLSINGKSSGSQTHLEPCIRILSPDSKNTARGQCGGCRLESAAPVERIEHGVTGCAGAFVKVDDDGVEFFRAGLSSPRDHCRDIVDHNGNPRIIHSTLRKFRKRTSAPCGHNRIKVCDHDLRSSRQRDREPPAG